MRLNQYITEASFGSSNMKKAAKLITSQMGKAIGSKMYPFYGSNPIEMFKKANGSIGLGMSYVTSTGKVVRLNWERNKKSDTITSIDLWTDMKDMSRPTATLEIPENYNVIQSLKLIGGFIKNPRMGLLEAKGDKKRALAMEYDVDPDMSYAEVQKAVRKKKRLLVVKGVSEKSQLTVDLQSAEAQLAKKKEADPEILFEDLDDLVKMVATNIQPSLLITGMAGIGKTYTVTKVLQEILGPVGQKWVHIKGKLSPLGMYMTFFIHRQRLIVFDDSDSVFANQDTVNMLKAALDSYDVRQISWISPSTVNTDLMTPDDVKDFFAELEDTLATDPTKKGIKFPNKFDFTGQVIFISNLPESKVDKAIKSRSLTIDITLTAKNVAKRLRSIIDKIGGDLPLSDKNEVMDYLQEDYQGELNIRSFILGCRCKQSGSPNWHRLVKYA